MKTLVIYESKFGNTERVARAIGEKLGAGASVEMVVAGRSSTDISDIDLLVVGAPTQGHGVSPAVKSFLEALADDAAKGTLFAAFDTRFGRARWLTGSAAVGIAKRLENKGGRPVAEPESFIVSSTKGPLADGELERAGAWASGLLVRVGELIPAPETRKTA